MEDGRHGEVGNLRSESKLLIAGCKGPDILKLIAAINRKSRKRYEIVGFLDVDATLIQNGFRGYSVWDENKIEVKDFKGCSVCINVASSMPLRNKVVEKLRERGFKEFQALVHPDVDLWGVQYSEGIVVLGGCFIGPDVIIGPFSVLLMGANINHETKVGAYTFFGPSCTILGRVTVEAGAYIGAGAVLFPNVKIGAWAVVGAGSVVRKDVSPGEIVAGIPARSIGRNANSTLEEPVSIVRSRRAR
ncbi:acetyltransferase [Acidobacteriota bacterium]